MYELILYTAVGISYGVSLITVTVTRYICFNIFQMEHFSTVKFDKGYETTELACDTKIAKIMEKKNLKKIGLSSFNCFYCIITSRLLQSLTCVWTTEDK